MAKERKIEILDELKLMTKRIQSKHDEGLKKYWKKTPEAVSDRIFLSMREISSLINEYELINSLSAEEYEAIANRNSASDLFGNVFYIIEHEVEFLKENYYYSIVSEFCDFCEKIAENFSTDECNKIKDLIFSIKKLSYIHNHPEFCKIKSLMNNFDEILDARYDINIKRFDKIYQLLGFKEVLLEHEERLNDIVSISDINLKRAIYTYLDVTIEICYNN